MARRGYRNRRGTQEEREAPPRPKGPDPLEAEAAPLLDGGSRVVRRKPACACGGTCPKCAAEDGIQAKSAVGRADHPAERQADRAAERVTGRPPSTPAPAPTRPMLAEPAGAGTPPAPARGAPAGPAAQADPASGAASPTSTTLASGGEPLSPSLRDYFEPRFGRDFSEVRLHQGGEARDLNDTYRARAFTYGDHVWLGRDAEAGPNPLLAHELAHVAQNQDGEGEGATVRRQEVPDRGPGAEPADPMSLTQSVDTAEMSGRELEAEVEELREWLRQNAARGADPEYQRLGQEMSRMEQELGRRQAVLVGTGRLVAEGDLLFLNHIGIGGVFFSGMAGGMLYEVSPRQLARFIVLLVNPPPLMILGFDAGVIEGIGIDLLANLEGLVSLAELAASLTPEAVVQSAMEEALRLALDERHRALRAQQARIGMEIVSGIMEFLEAVERNPRLLYYHSEDLGREVGIRAADWFNDDFMQRTDFQKGRAMGNVAGVVLTEILLLFLGPEEWIARGVTAAGQLTRVTTRVASGAGRLSGAMVRIVEHLPGLSRVIRALEELGAAGRGGMRAAEEVAGGAGAIGRAGAEEAGGLARAGGEGGEALRGAAETGEATPLPHASEPAASTAPAETAPAAPPPARTEAPAAPSTGGTGSGTGSRPRFEVLEGGGQSSPRRDDHLFAVPDEGRPPGPGPDPTLPEAQAQPVPEEEVLDLAAGAEGMSTRAPAADPTVPRASASEEGGGGRVLDFPAGQGTRGTRTRRRGASGAAGSPGGPPGAPPPAAARVPFQRMQLEELVDANGQFTVRPGAEKRIRRLEQLYQEYRTGGGTADRAAWVRLTRHRQARGILNGVLEPDWMAQATERARRATRLAEARRLVQNDTAWRLVESMQERFPALREMDLIPVRRDRMRPGLHDESMGTDQGLYSFEAIDRQGNTIQIDGFDDAGCMIENKSRDPSGHIEREMDELNFSRRELALQMRRQLQFVEEAGLPRLIWQTNSPDLVDVLTAIVREEGFGSRVQIVDLSAHAGDGPEIPFGSAIDLLGPPE